MPSHPRNMPEQERSIKARSHELFVEPDQASGALKPTKPFPTYLRETPAQPLSAFTKAVFWMIGLIVAGLFLAAIWRISHRQKAGVPAVRRPAKTTNAQSRLDLDRSAMACLDGVPRRPLAGLAYLPDGEPSGVIRYR